jgi:diguanylate cyclase (GGDEF)-like protein
MAESATPMPEPEYESLLRSYLEARREIERLSTLREIGVAVTATLELDETLTQVADVVQGAIQVKRLSIFEYDQGTESLRPIVAKYGEDLISAQRLEEDEVRLEGTPMGEALRGRRVVLENDAFETVAYVPLMAKNSAVGVMRVEDKQDGAPFTQEDADFYYLVGSHIAIAINNAQLYSLAVTDGLTGLYVRRYFDLRLGEEFKQAVRYGRDFSVMLFDIDHFKKFNDMHGHQTGDMVLQDFAGLIQQNTRGTDICCRYGGEEMAVILPETTLAQASVSASKLCRTIGEHTFRGLGGKRLNVTCSIGVAAHNERFADPAAMVKASDDALYRAKENGRNRVELAD